MAWFTVLGFLLVACCYAYIRAKAKLRDTAIYLGSSMNALSIEDAKGHVESLFMNGHLLFVGKEESKGYNEKLAALGPITREYFSKYPNTKAQRGGFQLSIEEIHPSEYVTGYLSIGHNEDWDIVQRPGYDEVFVVEGSEASESQMETRFPTVYHLILDAVRGT